MDHNAEYNETCEKSRETILHIACKLKSSLRYVYVLLYPRLLTIPDINGHLPIHVACQQNDVQFLSWIFNSVLCKEGVSSIYRCSVLGSTVIEATVASRITPPLSSMKYSKLSATTLTGHSVYHIAVSQGYSQLLGLLLDVLGVTQDEFELDTVTTLDYVNKLAPLDVAIAHQETECVRLLLEFLNKFGLLQMVAQEQQAMKIATAVGDANIMKLLVKYGFSQGLEEAIGKVQDQQLKRLLLYYYTQLTSAKAIIETQSDYKKGLTKGQIRWNGADINMLDLAWINDCFSAMESISQAIRQADVTSQSLYDHCIIQYLALECLSYCESEKLCTEQLNPNPLIPITVIEITSCSLMSVPPELFQLHKLEVLKLSNNSIQELPTALHSSQCIYSSQSLRKLVLDGNKLKTLPEDLFLGLVNSLEHLSVQKNELTELPPGLWVMPHLKELNLSENKLSQLHYLCLDSNFSDGHSISRQIAAATESNYCVLSEKGSSEPGCDAWKYIERLHIFYKTLHLATNGKFYVENVTEWIQNLHVQRDKEKEKEELDSESENALLSLTFCEEFETSALLSLNLSQNMFSKIPEELPCLAPKLQYINMSQNCIEYLDLVHSMPRNVATIRLDHNFIQDMATPAPHAPVSRCSSACMLLLLQSGDSDCTHTTHNQLKSLTTLTLGYNRLAEFHAIDINTDLDAENVVCTMVVHFPQLSVLSLEHNELTSVPPSILNLTSLNSLNLAHNTGIVSLPSGLGLLSLSTLNLEGLSLAGIPKNLVEKLSPKYLLSYLKGIVHGLVQNLTMFFKSKKITPPLPHSKESYRHMKLMLAGSANAGKTTLLFQLTKKGKMAHQRTVQMGVNGLPLSTVGVELGQWEYSPMRNLPVITFMTWDFGGQVGYVIVVLMYAMLCMYISHRLYTLICIYCGHVCAVSLAVVQFIMCICNGLNTTC